MAIMQGKNETIEKLLNLDVVAQLEVTTGNRDFLNTSDISDLILRKSEIPTTYWSKISSEIKERAESVKNFINTYPNFGEYEKNFINFCLNIAYNIHADEKRKTGVAYFDHPIKVMLNLIQKTPNYLSLAAAAMHDVPESYVEHAFKKQENELKNKIHENIWDFHAEAQKYYNFNKEFLHALKYELFKFEDIGRQKVPLESYSTIIKKYHSVQERKFKNFNSTLENEKGKFLEEDINENINSGIYEALKTIFLNKAKAKLREQYLEKLKDKLAVFIFNSTSTNEDFRGRKTHLKLLMDPMISNLSRYKGPIQSYYQHLNDISPYQTFDENGNTIISSGAVPNRKYTVEDYKRKTEVRAHLTMSLIKSSDRLANIRELWSFGNDLPKERLAELNNSLEELYNSDKETYCREKDVINDSHRQPKIGKPNTMNGQKRLYEIAKSLMALNTIRMQRIYLQEKGYNYSEMESIINMQGKLAEAGMEQSEMHALHLKYFHKEVNIDFSKKAEEDLKKYEHMGGLSKITEMYKGGKMTSKTSYKRFDGTMRTFAKIMLHHDPTAMEISEDKQTQYLASIAFKREFELFKENSNYYIKGFENILPPVLRQPYAIQQNTKEGEKQK